MLLDAKTPESSKICQRVVAFTYLVYLNIFSRIFEKYSSQKTPKNWKSFFVKISSLRNFINDIRDVNCNEVLINLVNLCDKRVGEWSS